jgi:uncharacterized membrane protein YdjX (TVP38/TMEM64 family)
VAFSLTVVACHGTAVSTTASTATSVAAFVHARLLLRAAFLASHGLVLESLLEMKRLFLAGEGEVAFAVTALQGLVGEVAFSVSLFSWDIFAR